MAMVDVLTRARDLHDHYTDWGMMPRVVALEHWSNTPFNLFFATGSAAGVLALFGAALACHVAMLVGYHTRLATAASWYFVTSVINRNSMITSSADSYLRMLLLWGIFLPLGERLSVDAHPRAPDERTHRPTHVFSMATVSERNLDCSALVLQSAC